MQKELIPRKRIESEGKVAYSERFQAWNQIYLKKELFSEFPQLKEKRSKFSYKIVYYRSPEEILNEIKGSIKRGDKVMPLLVWIYRDET